MELKIDQQIYKILLEKAGGKQNKIDGLSPSALSKMKNGNIKIPFSKLFEVMQKNGITGIITLKSLHTQMDIEVDKKEVFVRTKSIKQ